MIQLEYDSRYISQLLVRTTEYHNINAMIDWLQGGGTLLARQRNPNSPEVPTWTRTWLGVGSRARQGPFSGPRESICFSSSIKKKKKKKRNGKNWAER